MKARVLDCAPRMTRHNTEAQPPVVKRDAELVHGNNVATPIGREREPSSLVAAHSDVEAGLLGVPQEGAQRACRRQESPHAKRGKRGSFLGRFLDGVLARLAALHGNKVVAVAVAVAHDVVVAGEVDVVKTRSGHDRVAGNVSVAWCVENGRWVGGEGIKFMERFGAVEVAGAFLSPIVDKNEGGSIRGN